MEGSRELSGKRKLKCLGSWMGLCSGPCNSGNQHGRLHTKKTTCNLPIKGRCKHYCTCLTEKKALSKIALARMTGNPWVLEDEA